MLKIIFIIVLFSAVISKAQKAELDSAQACMMKFDGKCSTIFLYRTLHRYPQDSLAVVSVLYFLSTRYYLDKKYDSVIYAANYVKEVARKYPLDSILYNGVSLQHCLLCVSSDLYLSYLEMKLYKEALEEIKKVKTMPDESVNKGKEQYPFISPEFFEAVDAADEARAYSGLLMPDSVLQVAFKYFFYPWPSNEFMSEKLKPMIQEHYTAESWREKLEQINTSVKILNWRRGWIEITPADRPVRFEWKDETVMQWVHSEEDFRKAVKKFLLSREMLSLVNKQ
jgi:hypothetical protein